MEFDKENPFSLLAEEQEELANLVIAGNDDLWPKVVDAYRTALLKNNNSALAEALRSGLENAFGLYLPVVMSSIEDPFPS